MSQKPKIFISYSWDSDGHKTRVSNLANSFRGHGIECIIDNFKDYLDDTKSDWETWIDINIQSSDYILVVCTENYKNCFEEKQECLGDGGVKWEAQLLRILLKNTDIKIQTIIFNEQDKDFIPLRLRGKNRFCISEPEFDLNNEESGYCKIYRQLTQQYQTEADIVGEIVILPLKKENLLNKLINFVINNSIDLEALKEISKKFLNQIYYDKINKSLTVDELVTYLDGIIIDNTYQPLACIISYMYQEKNSTNLEIKSWLDANLDNAFCTKSKNDIEVRNQNDESQENRIILDFEKSENSSKVDLSIRYFEDGKFVSNEGKIFTKEDIKCDKFQKRVLDKIYDDLYLYQHIDIVLPQQILLTDVKQWNYQDEKDYIDICLTDKCCVNIHMRERAFGKSHKIKEMWESVVNQLEKPLKESMKDMTTPKEKVTKDTFEVGLKYRFLPNSERNFSDRIIQKMITLRCGDSEKLEEFNQWLDDNKNLTLGQLKKEVDKSENAHMTIMWSDPNIPLKGDGIDAK